MITSAECGALVDSGVTVHAKMMHAQFWTRFRGSGVAGRIRAKLRALQAAVHDRLVTCHHGVVARHSDACALHSLDRSPHFHVALRASFIVPLSTMNTSALFAQLK